MCWDANSVTCKKTPPGVHEQGSLSYKEAILFSCSRAFSLQTIQTRQSSGSVEYLVEHTLNSKASYSQMQRDKTGCRDGTRERGNRGRRLEGVRFPRPWGNFVPVLIDFRPFEILLPIKLTVCWAISAVPQTFFLKFLLLYKQSSRAPSIQTIPTAKFIFWTQLMLASTQREQVSSSNWDLREINKSIKISHSHQLPANTSQ